MDSKNNFSNCVFLVRYQQIRWPARVRNYGAAEFLGKSHFSFPPLLVAFFAHSHWVYNSIFMFDTFCSLQHIRRQSDEFVSAVPVNPGFARGSPELFQIFGSGLLCVLSPHLPVYGCSNFRKSVYYDFKKATIVDPTALKALRDTLADNVDFDTSCAAALQWLSDLADEAPQCAPETYLVEEILEMAQTEVCCLLL